MERILLPLLLMVSVAPVLQAQKLGYIDSEHILNKMPEYAKAQDEINRLSRAWQEEIEGMHRKVNNLYTAFEQEKVLLTEDMRKERMQEIRTKETELTAYQKKIFGFEGMFFLKKQELIKPLQDKVFGAVRKVARSKKLAIVFDKAGELVMMYTDPTYDYTDFVLEIMELGDSNDTIK